MLIILRYKYNYAGKADGIPVAGDSAKIQECLAFALQDLTDLGKSLESGDLSKWLKSPLWFFFKCTERQLRDALEGMQGRTSPNKSDGLAVKRPPPSNESGIACWETCYEVIKVWQGPEAMCCSYIRSLIGCLYTEQKDLKKGAEYLNCAIRRKASMLPGWAPTEFHDIHAELQLGILYFKEMSVEEHAALRKSKEHIERALKGLDNCEAKANVQLKQNDEADNWKAAKMVALFYMAELHRRLKFCAPDRRESIKKAEVAMRECGFDDAAIEKAWMDD